MPFGSKLLKCHLLFTYSLISLSKITKDRLIIFQAAVFACSVHCQLFRGVVCMVLVFKRSFGTVLWLEWISNKDICQSIIDCFIVRTQFSSSHPTLHRISKSTKNKSRYCHRYIYVLSTVDFEHRNILHLIQLKNINQINR